MTPPTDPATDRPISPQPVRQPGWVVVCGMVGAAMLVIGLLMLAMIQAPAVRAQVILTSLACIGAGIILLPIAWMKRCRRPSHSAAEHRAQEADNTEPTPPNEG